MAGKRKSAFRRIPWVLLLALSLPLSAGAQGWVEPLRPRSGVWVERVETKIRVEVRNSVAQVVVDEWFRAHGRGLGEADYFYPLPVGAAFQSFSLYQGGEELTGELMDAEEARQIYEEIVRRRRDPALIELAGHGLLRARVFPLNPGETRKVTLRYSQLLPRAGDALQFRYQAGTSRAAACSGDGAKDMVRCSSQAPPLELEIRVLQGEDYLEPFSPTHPLQAERQGSTLVVRSRGSLSGPFALFLPLAREGLGLSLATHKPLGEDGYFLLSLSPGMSDAPPEPRDVSIVLDVSGSMSGEKIQQARQALLDLLDTLSPHDRFRLVAFSNAVRPFSLQWQEATPDDLAKAREWVRGLEANGGTNMAAALEEGLRLSSPGNRLPVTVFLTDGLPTVGETSVDAITRRVQEQRGRMRIFAFGVGHDVNTALLDRMSEEGRGSTNYVEPGESVERALSLLSTKIRHPVLTDLAVTGAPVRLKEIYPVQIPDVFQGEELVLFGRYEMEGEETGRGRLTLEGRRRGETQRFSMEARFPEREDGNAFLPRLWASRKLGFLTRRVWTEGENEELAREIRQLALRYGLPSPFTSYLVMEPEAQWARAGGIRALPGRRDQTAAPLLRAATQGAEAVDRARRAKAFRDVASMAELVEVEEDVFGASLGVDETSRSVAGRLFRLENGVWRDVAVQDQDPVLNVAPFSRAYFDLLDRIPELKPIAQEFATFEVQGETLRIRIGDDGVEELDDAALDSARQDFRPNGPGGVSKPEVP